MSAQTWARRILSVITALSFFLLLIGIISLFALPAGNNPFILNGSGDVYGPLSLIVFIILGILFVGGFVLLVVWSMFSRLSDSDTDQPADQSAGTGQAKQTKDVDKQQKYLHSFRKSNFYIALLLAIVLTAHAIMQALINTMGPNQVFNIISGLLAFAVAIFGGQTNFAIAVIIFAAIWYGLKQEATEAVLAGIVAWILIGFIGLGYFSANASGFGLVIAGFYGMYYGIRGFSAAEPATPYGERLLEELREGPTMNQELTASNEDSPSGAEFAASDGPVGSLRQTLAETNIRSPGDLWRVIDIDPVFVHPREAETSRLTYWSYLSYALGTLTILTTILVGIRVWGFPTLGLWGLLVGALYLGHGFGLPQRSDFVHVGGLVWYAFALFLALYTVSPLAFLVNAGGMYLGWRATEGIHQPEELIAEFQDSSASSSQLGTGLLGSGLVGGVIIGAVLGGLGAAIFAWISVETKSVFGLFVLLPAVGAGFGVSLGVGERGGLISGVVAAGLGIVSIGLGFRLLSWWMPRGYTLEPDILLAVVPIIGIYLAYKLGTGLRTDSSTRESAQPTSGDSGEGDIGTEGDSSSGTD